MVIVPTYLDKSTIHGFGVFAGEFIPKGTKVWEFHPLFDITLTEEEFEQLPPSVKQEVGIHLYQPEDGGALHYESTIGKYMNHSQEPNVDFREVAVGWATRDIARGEELTCDYRQFMADVSGIDYL